MKLKKTSTILDLKLSYNTLYIRFHNCSIAVKYLLIAGNNGICWLQEEFSNNGVNVN
jgi:hypothetical protein